MPPPPEQLSTTVFGVTPMTLSERAPTPKELFVVRADGVDETLVMGWMDPPVPEAIVSTSLFTRCPQNPAPMALAVLFQDCQDFSMVVASMPSFLVGWSQSLREGYALPINPLRWAARSMTTMS